MNDITLHIIVIPVALAAALGVLLGLGYLNASFIYPQLDAPLVIHGIILASLAGILAGLTRIFYTVVMLAFLEVHSKLALWRVRKRRGAS